VDLDRLFIDVAEYNERVMGPAHVNNVVDEAVKTSLTRRAVSHINIPKDIQSWSPNGDRSKANVPKHSADLFSAAHPLPRPEELADRVAGPVYKPLLGKAVLPDDSPYTTGGIGLLGTAPSQDAMQNCDTLIIAGSSFPYI